MDAIPPECLVKDTARSMMYAVTSTAITAAVGLAAWALIPMQAAWWPAWVAYACAAGTAATGMWVVAHECGHNAFSDNRVLQDTVGYILHSLLLVPYFSWQRSHAVHHAHTNHITEGETHVPPVLDARPGVENEGGEAHMNMARALGRNLYAVVHLVQNLVFGWPAYLLFGASGGPKY